MTNTEITIQFVQKSTLPHFKDLEGQVFGRLTILGYAGKKRGKTSWFCRCECGNVCHKMASNLQRGITQSCGCLNNELVSQRRLKHGESRGKNKTPEYKAFAHAKRRCIDPNNNRYSSYGGRGIEFRFESFEQFLAEIGRKPTPMHTIDRVDVNGHYEAGNIRWATTQEQANNKQLHLK